MFCKKCGKQIEDNSKFCSGCGIAIIEETEINQNIVENKAVSNEKPNNQYFENKKRATNSAILMIVLFILLIANLSNESAGYLGLLLFASMISWCIFQLKVEKDKSSTSNKLTILTKKNTEMTEEIIETTKQLMGSKTKDISEKQTNVITEILAGIGLVIIFSFVFSIFKDDSPTIDSSMPKFKGKYTTEEINQAIADAKQFYKTMGSLEGRTGNDWYIVNATDSLGEQTGIEINVTVKNDWFRHAKSLKATGDNGTLEQTYGSQYCPETVTTVSKADTYIHLMNYNNESAGVAIRCDFPFSN